MKNKYAQIKDLIEGKNFNFFNNFQDQVFKTKTICINDVGYDWFDCLSDDEQTAFEDYLLNLKEDDYDFYIETNDKQIKQDFYYHCSMYDDLKHIKERI